MIRIKSYATAKKDGSGSGNKVVNIFAKNDNTQTSTPPSTNATEAEKAKEAETAEKLKYTHTIFGHPFNGTQDVTGDIATDGDITANNLDIFGEANFHQTIKLNNNNIEGVNGVKSKFINTTELHTQTIDNSDTITTKNLKVTGKAEFFNLIIDKINSSGGAHIYTPCDGFKAEIVEQGTDGSYTLFWQSKDDEGTEIDNMWRVNDQAICKTFNLEPTNQYYWALVTNVGNSTIKNGKTYHSIKLSPTVYDGTLTPKVGDEISMLGYRGTDDIERQSAIYISSYNSLDTELTAPLLAQYRGINDFNLSTHRTSYFDAKKAEFWGDFKVGGLTPDEYIDNKVNDIDTHAPYIGTNGNWWVWDKTQKKYVDSQMRSYGIDGNDGKTPYIKNGTWWIGNTDTGTQAEGNDGKSPYIDENTGTWFAYINGKWQDTGIKAQGNDGSTPYIKNGTWWIGNTNTGVKAEGTDGKTPYIKNGTWWIGDTDTGIKAQGQNGTYIETLFATSFTQPRTPTITNDTQISGSGWSKVIPTQLIKINNVVGSSEEVGNYRVLTTDNASMSFDKITFETTSANQTISFNLNADCEEGFDFIWVGDVDTNYEYSDELYNTIEQDTNHATGEDNKTINKTIATAGKHFIYVIFIRDMDGWGGSDLGRYTITNAGYIWKTSNNAQYDNTNSRWNYTGKWSEPMRYSDKGEPTETYNVTQGDTIAIINADETISYKIDPYVYHIIGDTFNKIPPYSISAYFYNSGSYQKSNELITDGTIFQTFTKNDLGQINKIYNVDKMVMTVTPRENVIPITLTINVNYGNGVVFDINQELGTVKSTVLSHDGKISQIEQKSDEISLGVDNLKNDLLKTGIDITNRNITITANKFNLQTNEGKNVIQTNAQSEVSFNGVINAKRITQQYYAVAKQAIGDYVKGDDGKYYGVRHIQVDYVSNSDKKSRYTTGDYYLYKGRRVKALYDMDGEFTANNGFIGYFMGDDVTTPEYWAYYHTNIMDWTNPNDTSKRGESLSRKLHYVQEISTATPQNGPHSISPTKLVTVNDYIITDYTYSQQVSFNYKHEFIVKFEGRYPPRYTGTANGSFIKSIYSIQYKDIPDTAIIDLRDRVTGGIIYDIKSVSNGTLVYGLIDETATGQNYRFVLPSTSKMVGSELTFIGNHESTAFISIDNVTNLRLLKYEADSTQPTEYKKYSEYTVFNPYDTYKLERGVKKIIATRNREGGTDWIIE